MDTLSLSAVEVFYLVQNGRPVAYSPFEAVIREQIPNDESGFEVVSKSESAGTAKGEVLDWSKRGGHSFTPKLHWNCPQCGQPWWEDFAGKVDNPYFGTSGCECARWWWVHWDPVQAAAELTFLGPPPVKRTHVERG